MIETLDTIEGVARIADDWRSIARRFPSPLLQYDWFMAAALAFCPPDKLQVIVKRKGGTITAIAPLALMKGQSMGRLEILGTEILCEPSGLLYKSEPDAAELFDYIIGLKKPAVFRRLSVDSPELGILESKKKGLGFQAERSSGSPWLSVTPSWQDFEKNIASKDRYTLRRSRKRADALGSVEFDFRSPTRDEVGPCMDELVRIESKSWKESNGTSLGTYSSLNRFFSEYMLSAAGDGILRVNFLKINGVAVAFLMAVEYSNRYWVLKISFDEAFSQCSPGTLLMHESIHWVFDRKLEAFEFLGTDESWLHVWTDAVHQYVAIHLYPLSLSGLFNLGSDSTSFLLNRIPTMKPKSGKE